MVLCVASQIVVLLCSVGGKRKVSPLQHLHNSIWLSNKKCRFMLPKLFRVWKRCSSGVRAAFAAAHGSCASRCGLIVWHASINVCHNDVLSCTENSFVQHPPPQICNNPVVWQPNRFVQHTKRTPATTPLYHTRPCLLYTSPSPRDGLLSRMPSSA